MHVQTQSLYGHYTYIHIHTYTHAITLWILHTYIYTHTITLWPLHTHTYTYTQSLYGYYTHIYTHTVTLWPLHTHIHTHFMDAHSALTCRPQALGCLDLRGQKAQLPYTQLHNWLQAHVSPRHTATVSHGLPGVPSTATGSRALRVSGSQAVTQSLTCSRMARNRKPHTLSPS